MYRTLFPRDLFAELDRLQRDMSSFFDPRPAFVASAVAATRR
jgi:HSP20 family protein